MKKWLIAFGFWTLIGFALLLTIAPDFTIHRREGLASYSHWLHDPSAATEAEFNRQMDINHRIQFEFAAVGSALICGILFGTYFGGRRVIRNVTKSS
jgi:hypothetical protein